MPLAAAWHKPGKTYLFLTIFGAPRGRWGRLRSRLRRMLARA
jgi:hypothetical protein